MSTPPYPYLPGPFETQNLKDDDSQVMESLYKEVQAPADIKYGVQPTAVIPQFKPVPVTKLFTATVTFIQSVTADPYMLLPEDVNRETCRIRVYSASAAPTSTDFVLIGGDRGTISARQQNYLITGHHLSDIDLDVHTGQVWVIPGPTLSGNIEVTAWGVSSYDR